MLDRGIRKTWSAVTEQEKAVARLDVIMKAMTDQGAVGAAVREADSLANQLKRLSAQVRDTAAAVGEALMPAATDLVGQANAVAMQFSKWASENLALITTTAKATVELAAFSAAAVAVGTVVRATTATIAGMRVAMVAIGSHPVLAAIGAATAAIMALDSWVDRAYRNSDRLGKRLAEIGPPRKLTPEEAKGGPYMTDRQGNPILDMTVADFYGDGKPETGPKSGFKNGVGFGREKGTFSNGRSIGGEFDPWDNPSPRQAPHVGTPGVDRLSQHLANLGLNGYEQNTSDPSGRAGAAALVKIWDGAMEKVNESMVGVSDAVDDFIAPMVQRLQPAIDAAGDISSAGGSKAIATLDASMAAQQFGGMGDSPEVQSLKRIERQNEKVMEMLAANLSQIGWINIRG